MILQRMTNNHSIARFFPDKSRQKDPSYVREVELALFELFPKGWRDGGCTVQGYSRLNNYVINSFGKGEILCDYTPTSHDYDLVVEIKEPSRTIDLSGII